MPASNLVVVEGFKELSKAFKVADKTLAKELRTTLRKVVEPIRVDAEALALSGIPRVGIPWSRMRIGIIQSGVYLAPRQRGTRAQAQKRPNLAGLLLGRSMLPAAAAHEHQVIEGFDALLADVGQAWEEAA